jgi:hypothetical protein
MITLTVRILSSVLVLFWFKLRFIFCIDCFVHRQTLVLIYYFCATETEETDHLIDSGTSIRVNVEDLLNCSRNN